MAWSKLFTLIMSQGNPKIYYSEKNETFEKREKMKKMSNYLISQRIIE